jgi:c-di-GMP-binding flagellar brake protein YcgR
MPAVGDKLKSIIVGATYVVKTIRDKMVVLERHNKKSLRKNENRGKILRPNSVYRPLKEYFKDRRKYPRVHMELPLEYRVKYDAQAHGAIVIDASEGGFLIYSIEDIPIGEKLEITVLFSAEYELGKIEAFAEIIWKNVDVEKGDVEKGEEGYQYGLKFIQILEEDYWKLRGLLSGRFK